jgi:hypothetical protein
MKDDGSELVDELTETLTDVDKVNPYSNTTAGAFDEYNARAPYAPNNVDIYDSIKDSPDLAFG